MPTRNYKTAQRRRLLQQPLTAPKLEEEKEETEKNDTSSILESITGDILSNASAEKKDEQSTEKQNKDEGGLPLFQSIAIFPSSAPSSKAQQEKEDTEKNDTDDILNDNDIKDGANKDFVVGEKEEKDGMQQKELDQAILDITTDNPKPPPPGQIKDEKEDATTVISEDNTNAPIIYTYNDNDSDSVSQITSSIAGSSYYQPPLRAIGVGAGAMAPGGVAATPSVAGESYGADSLDEVAFLLNPTPSVIHNVSSANRRTAASSAINNRVNNAGITTQSQGIFPPKESFSRYTNRFDDNNKGSNATSSSSLYSGTSSNLRNTNSSRCVPSKSLQDPIPEYFSTTSSKSSFNHSKHGSKSILTHLSQHTSEDIKSKLYLWYYRMEQIFLPPPLRSGKKSDDYYPADLTVDENVDYFEKLMSPEFLSSNHSAVFDGSADDNTFGGTANSSYQRQRKEAFRNLQKRKFWFVVFRLSWLVMLFSSFVAGVRLAMRRAHVQRSNNMKDGGKIDLGNKNYEWDSNMGMIRPIAGVVEEYQSNNNFDNNNNNFDVPQGDPLDSLLPEIKLRPNGLGQPDVNMRHIGMTLPAVFDNLADVIEFPTNDVNGIVPGGLGGGIGGPEGDIPFFWHIPRAGGATMNDVLGSCLQLTLASDAGGRDGHDKDKKLVVLKFSKHLSYVNVDTSTIEGIERCKRLGLTSSGIADVIVTSLFHEAASMFTPRNRGRMFALFRHPIERAVSLFHFVQDTHWRNKQTFQQDLADLTIEDYFRGGIAENNWMTRFLTGELIKGELDEYDLDLAKEILRRKCLIGLLKEKGESFARVETYFGWHLKSEADRECHEKKLDWLWPLKHRHEDVQEGTELWDLIMRQNVYDVQLYEYAQLLFKEQAQFFQSDIR